jgi:hypothetical protein
MVLETVTVLASGLEWVMAPAWVMEMALALVPGLVLAWVRS